MTSCHASTVESGTLKIGRLRGIVAPTLALHVGLRNRLGGRVSFSLAIGLIGVFAAYTQAWATHCVLPADLPKNTISGVAGGYAQFGKYIPRRIFGLKELPADVRAELDRYLDDWLGTAMRGKMQFAGGQFANTDDFLGAYPEAASFAKSQGWKNFTYNLLFDVSVPEAGIEKFVTTVRLDARGHIMVDLQFPPTGRDRNVATFVPLRDVYAAAENAGFDPKRTTGRLIYNEFNRRLVIEVLEPIECSSPIAKYKGLQIDFHDGHVIGSFEEGHPHDMASPF